MPGKLRRRFWVEAGVTAASGLCFLMTSIWPDWLEMAFGWDPDHHNGSAEWLVAGALLVISGIMFAVARTEWRRTAMVRV